MNQKGFATIIPVIIILVALFGIGAGVFFYGRSNSLQATPTPMPIYSVTPAPTITPYPEPLLSKKITTSKGALTLTYQNGIATLSGTLSRSTPCIEWYIQTVTSEDNPPSEVTFAVKSKSNSEICIQVLGKPQEISAQSPASKNTLYTVNYESLQAFSGVLSALSIPKPTSIPSGLYSYTELKYLLMQRFNPIFFCDPDYYPIGRGDEQQLAIEKFPSIQQNIEEFEAILRYDTALPRSMESRNDYTDAQKLQIYREHKKLSALILGYVGAPDMDPNIHGIYSFSLRSGDESKGSGLAVQGAITVNGSISIFKSETSFLTCPICLARGTKISTPSGEIPVQDLQIGMKVWTTDSNGVKRKAEILQVSKTPVPADHQMVHLVLSDGRELLVSPGHPTADGRIIRNLMPGNILNGVTVLSAERTQYNQEFTYDILPSGDTGTYWANGILIGSTLKK